MLSRAFGFVLAIALTSGATACSSDAPAPAASPDGGDGCPTGEKKNEAGQCRIVLPPATCTPGTMPRMGERECQPVGFTACAAGFVADESGWGCREVVSAVACKGATRDALGRTENNGSKVGNGTIPLPAPLPHL